MGSAEEIYRVLFDHVDNMVCTLDLAGRITSVNTAGERLTGYPANDLVGLPAVELIAPELREQAVRQFDDRLAGPEEASPDESVLVTRDGRRVPIRITSTLLVRNGEPAAVLGVVHDLTERRSAEEALARSEQRFRMLLEAAPDGAVIADAAGTIVLVNAQTERLFGYEREELIGKRVEILLPEEVRKAHPGHRAGYLRDPKVRDMGAGLPLAGKRKDGSLFPVDVSLSPLQTGDGVLVLASVRDVSERKRAEEALQESERRFRGAFESAAIGMAIVAADGSFVEVNDSLCGIVGYTREELVALTFQDITHPDDLDTDLELVRQTLSGEIRTYELEKRYLSKAGETVWVILSVSLVRAGDGTPRHFVSQIQDITERKRAEEELARSEARLAEAQRIGQIGNWEMDLAGETITWSDELYRVFGVDASEEITFDRFQRCIHPDDLAEFLEVVGRVRETGGSYSHEYRTVLPGGAVGWVQGRGEVELGPDGPRSMRGVAQDISERKAAEERLAEAELRYRTLVEQLPLATYIRPLDLGVPNVYASPQVEPILGYPASEWTSNPDLLAAIVHPDDRDRVLADAERVRTTGEPTRAEYRYVRPDGSVVWVHDETYLVPGEDGEPQCVQGYLLDITERKQAEEERDRLREELHHAQKLEAIGRLAGGVAHDFNNMLTAIKGYSELLLEGLEPGNPLRSEAEQISRAATQASALPKQLLAFSRKQVLEPRLIDLNTVVEDASDLLRLLLGESIELVCRPLAATAAVVADPGQVEQVLINLAANARDAMPSGGRVTIETTNAELDARAAGEHDAAPGPYVVVSVADTGEGMDPETLEHVFEPFFTTKGGRGSGLGLASAYGITRQSGGFIRATSTRGAGSTFALHFPLAGAAAEAPASANVVAPGAVAPAGTVLLVEDEDLVRDFAGRALERAGFRVLTASHGARALELWRGAAVPIDVLVSDIVMPGMDGRELAERILADDPEARVVLMSGYTDQPGDTVLAGGRSPGFLQKPFSLPTLVGAVRDAIERPRTNGRPARDPEGRTVTCLVADDHPAVLDSVARFLAAGGVEVVARSARGDEAIAAIEALRPQIALLDVAMEPVGGIEIARHAATLTPETRVILYTGHRDRALLEHALEAGAWGFVLKEAPLSELLRAIQVVADGWTFVDAELSATLSTPRAVERLSPLTAREREVLALVADGMTNERAGEALGISAETVQSHVRNAMSKLAADTRTQAVATALRQSLIP